MNTNIFKDFDSALDNLTDWISIEKERVEKLSKVSTLNRRKSQLEETKTIH